MELTFLLVLLVAPRPPHVDRHADRAVAQTLALGGEGEDVGHEHGRDLLLVDLVHLESTIQPGDAAASGRLRLADDERQAVDDEHDVEALRDRACLIRPLIADDQPVVARLTGVDEPHRHVLAVRGERHGLLASEPSHEVLVGSNQSVRLHG